MVACAAIAAQPPFSLVAPSAVLMTAASSQTVDQLKQQLLAAIENGSSEAACEVLSQLESVSITTEILESTRIGASVNEVRKKTQEQFPLISKRCRAIIKSWKKLVDDQERPAAGSTASSANGTPNVISPGAARLARRVTPATPVNRRVTSTGVNSVNGRSTTVSPANGGSYAPKQQILSPNINGMHKSQSVGVDLMQRGIDEIRNGKRKADETPIVGSSPATVPPAIKRTKTAIGSLASPSTPQSVSAIRRAVQSSTSELVAQLSMNLPDHMSIDSSIREHEEKVKREQKDEELAIQLYGGASTSTPFTLPERKKRKYERKIKPDTPSPLVTSDEKRGSLILRLPRTISTIKEETEQQEAMASTSTVTMSSTPASSSTGPSTSSEGSTTAPGSKTDWLAMLPSLDLLRAKAVEQQKAREGLKFNHGPTKAFVVQVHGRDVLALPYLDVPRRPDFLQYRYPNKAQYYAEENFAYGAPRPSESE